MPFAIFGSLFRSPHRLVPVSGAVCLLLTFGCAHIPEPSSPPLLSDASHPSCNCYYTLDCQGADFTQNAHSSLLICERNWDASPVCSEDNFESNTKYLDGLCLTLAISPEHFLAGVSALEAWLRAYEAGGRVGGSPDAQLVRTAQDQKLTDGEHSAIRSLVYHILSLTVGLTSYPDSIPHARGFFTMPTSKRLANSPLASHGRIARLNDTYLGALALIREGLIGELTDPPAHALQKSLSSIRRRFPRYTPFTRCEYPHPPSHGHLFPYSDGIACLEEELHVVVFSLRPASH